MGSGVVCEALRGRCCGISGTGYNVMLFGEIVSGMVNSRRGGQTSFIVCLKFLVGDVVAMSDVVDYRVGCTVLFYVLRFLAQDERKGIIFVVVLVERFDGVVSCWSVLLAFTHRLQIMSTSVVHMVDCIAGAPKSQIMYSSPGLLIMPLCL